MTIASTSLSFGKWVGNSFQNVFFFFFESIRIFKYFFFNPENPNAPMLTLKPPSSIVCLEYNPKDHTTLASGMLSGQVGCWDTRADKSLVAISELEVCHRGAVNSVLWINSKSGTEFFSGSFDGQVIWYIDDLCIFLKIFWI